MYIRLKRSASRFARRATRNLVLIHFVGSPGAQISVRRPVAYKFGAVCFLIRSARDTQTSFDVICTATLIKTFNAVARCVYKSEAVYLLTRSVRNAQIRDGSVYKITWSTNLGMETCCAYTLKVVSVLIRSARDSQPRFDTIYMIT